MSTPASEEPATPAVTLDSALRFACQVHAHRVAVTWRGRSLTYADLATASAALAAMYRARGLGSGDRVLCRLPNRPELLLSAWAAWRCGAIHTAADRDLTAPELSGLAAQLEPRLVLLESRDDPGYIAMAAALRRSSPSSEVLSCEDIGWSPGAPVDAGAGVVPPPVASPLEPAVLLTTTGTTGAPRHVVRQHGELAMRWWAAAVRSGASPGEARLVQLPLSHGFGLGMALGGLLTGGRLVLMERFSPDAAVGLIQAERIGVLHGAPAHFDLILSRLGDRRAPPADVSSLRAGCGSGAIFPASLVCRILDTLQLHRFTLSYGCSEGLGWSTSDPDDLRRGSVGRPPPELLRIVDPGDLRPVSAGTTGEIAIRRNQPVRYWGGAAEPGPSGSEDGGDAGEWYHTGDLGRIDGDGRLHVVGRLGTQICRGGLWVQPEEVEAALEGRPTVGDVAVIGVPDPLLGERVCACIVADGEPPSLDDLREWLAGSLARFKQPERLFLLAEIPRGPVGKIDRRRLREVVDAGVASVAS